MAQYNPSDKSRVRRGPKRAKYDKETIYGILDNNLIAHVGFIIDGQPFVIPMLYGRENDILYLHGASSSRLIRILDSGVTISISVAKIDGLVLARSAFHHSVNYRSVVVFGKARLVEEQEDKINALKVISDHILSGRWEEVRPPNAKELKATGVLSVAIDEASAKVRTGGPLDEKEDYELPVWAGVLPISEKYESPVEDQNSLVSLPLAESLQRVIKENHSKF